MNLAAPSGFSERAHNATTQMVEQLGIAIIAGEYPEGSLIPLDPDLEEMFGVSRTVVREAKKTLVAKGLLKSKAKVGTRVQPNTDWSMFDPDVLRWHTAQRNTHDFVVELCEIRRVFEPEAASLAARNRSDRDLAMIRSRFEKLAEAESYPAHIAADLEFHRAILHASGNRFLRSLGDIVEATLFSLLENETLESEVLLHQVAEHGDILQAIAARDEDGARRAMARVVCTTRSRRSQRKPA